MSQRASFVKKGLAVLGALSVISGAFIAYKSLTVHQGATIHGDTTLTGEVHSTGTPLERRQTFTVATTTPILASFNLASDEGRSIRLTDVGLIVKSVGTSTGAAVPFTISKSSSASATGTTLLYSGMLTLPSVTASSTASATSTLIGWVATSTSIGALMVPNDTGAIILGTEDYINFMISSPTSSEYGNGIEGEAIVVFE